MSFIYQLEKSKFKNVQLVKKKPNFDKMLSQMEESRSSYLTWIRQYYYFLSLAFQLVIQALLFILTNFFKGMRCLFAVLTFQYAEYQKRKILYTLDTNASNPFYYSLFSFLNVYFGVYYILPGKFVIDKLGIMHVIIQISERIKDGLSPLELGRGIQLRLINALKNSEQLFYIPSEYWTENTVYAPQVEANLKKKQVIIFIALSIAGAEHIQKLQQQEKQPIHEDMEETL